MPGLLRSDRGGLSVSSPSGERKDACGLPVSPSNTLDQLGLDPGRWRPRQDIPRQARFEARACSPRPPGSSRLRASSLALHPPRCTPRPRAKKFVQQVRAREESAPAKCHPDQRSARQQGRQDKHRDPGETDRAAAA
ncbi:uncharacterized protein LOC129659454 isoform X4 [Bubalus kerabau]|uniref:uncharacterized protein LOC129659454 isoform X4 n=1 Tax=Bubalus carabanensis TaxID=3119969 RepID=UPI00244E8AFB|nr:uncharacterized protein LOC129659454 isoform X4 [Bubalus carabanensis]